VYTNSGNSGKWEGLDVPAIRSFKVNAAAKESTVYAPVDTFGEIYMHADAWHTNAAGNELIAQALLEVLNKDYKVKDYLQKVNDAHLQAPLHDGLR
jgi:hypothetical protein